MAFAGPPPIAPINFTTAFEQIHPSTAGLAGGGYVVTWTSDLQDGSAGGIFGQLFDANGQPVGAEFPVNTTVADQQEQSETAALTDGGFVVCWTSNGQDGSLSGIYLQRFDAAAAAVGPETLVNTQTLGGQAEPSVLGLSTGGFAVVWTDSEGLATVRMQFYDAAGAAVGAEVIVAIMAPNHTALRPEMAELASGRIAVSWSDAQFGLLHDDPFFQLVRANGTLFGDPVQMNTTPDTLANQTQIVALAGGGFMAVWTESIGVTGAVGVGDARIVGRIYDNAGVAVTDEFTVSDDVTKLRYDPDVTLGGDGHVYVGWLEQTGLGEIYVMRGVDDTGALLGSQFYLGDLVPNTSLNRFIDITTLENGDLIATWQSWFGTSDIITRRIHTDQSDPRVSDADDQMTLTAGGEVLDALGGDDSITGGSGDDIVFGNTGFDTLTGGTGDDFLNGGGAPDDLSGAEGDDVLLGGDGADVLTGGIGHDRLYGENQSDTIEGAGGNDTIQGGAGSDDIKGGEGNDGIWGDHNPFAIWTDGTGAADTLLGGGGNDSLYGGSGDDLLDGGDGNDVLFGDDYSYDGLVEGDDTFTLSTGTDTMNGWGGVDTIDASAALQGLTLDFDPYGNGTGVYSSAGLYTGNIYVVENVIGTAFADSLKGNAMANQLTGNVGDDQFFGRAGADVLTGGAGLDVILGETGADLLDGGNAADTLDGGEGADTLTGGSSKDLLTGGAGNDQFLFNPGDGKDTVSDYAQGRDSVHLDAALWGGGLTAQQVLDTFGTLSANGNKLTLDFGASDVLILKDRGIDLATLAADLSF